MMSEEELRETIHRIEVIIRSGNSENEEYDKAYLEGLKKALNG
jgi:hypothetical protein